MAKPRDLSSPADETAVVIGAGSGIGRGTAILLARRGVRVLCVDRDEAAACGTADCAAAAGGITAAHEGDVTDPSSLTVAFTAALELSGRVHAVVNCAGIQGTLGRRSHEVDLEDLDKVYAVNLRGALAVTQMAVPHMLEHRYGRIAHVASIAGKEGNPGMVSYSATKAGLIGMVKAQGKEYAQDGITVNALAPAVIQTAFLDTQPDEVVAYMTEKIPMHRTGSIEEASQLLCWMVSAECSFTTGFTFDLSGGRATY